MTEAEWLTGTDIGPMLRSVGAEPNERKLRLFACACVRRVQHLWVEPTGPEEREWSRDVRSALAVGELMADGLATDDQVQRARFRDSSGLRLAQAFLGCAAAWDRNELLAVSEEARAEVGEWASDAATQAEARAQAALLRDIFGNPFRPVAFDPRWRTADVVAVARGIYEDRAFDRLPLLADALMDAGCESVDVLTHCRSDGPHARGCWVVDLVLGRE